MSSQKSNYNSHWKRHENSALLASWESAIRDYKINFEKLSMLIDQSPAYTNPSLIQVRDLSLTILESLIDSTFLSEDNNSPEQVATQLQTHTSILLQHNQTIKNLLNHLSSLND